MTTGNSQLRAQNAALRELKAAKTESERTAALVAYDAAGGQLSDAEVGGLTVAEAALEKAVNEAVNAVLKRHFDSVRLTGEQVIYIRSALYSTLTDGVTETGDEVTAGRAVATVAAKRLLEAGVEALCTPKTLRQLEKDGRRAA